MAKISTAEDTLNNGQHGTSASKKVIYTHCSPHMQTKNWGEPASEEKAGRGLGTGQILHRHKHREAQLTTVTVTAAWYVVTGSRKLWYPSKITNCLTL